MTTDPAALSDFDWEREYGAMWRACPSAFWLEPRPGDRKRDVIDIRKAKQPEPYQGYSPLNSYQQNPYAFGLLAYQYRGVDTYGLGGLLNQLVG